MKPIYYVIRVDETQHWRADIVARAGGKIFGVYAYDATERTHLCEATPSYALHIVSYVPAAWPESEDERGALDDDLVAALSSSDLVSYMHCSRVDAIANEDRAIIDAEDSETIDDAIATYCENPVF